ncbi:hypothetical protein E2C01_072105 [Portunus trituberculatus]|uniref:Uncharacterized protein n=1 Tax=Portunus trituberculatus TaxID=210409 RepID=A0A5B7I6W5_PORTR|nr:hypothetical protein [Portunus trituberculatus]
MSPLLVCVPLPVSAPPSSMRVPFLASITFLHHPSFSYRACVSPPNFPDITRLLPVPGKLSRPH